MESNNSQMTPDPSQQAAGTESNAPTQSSEANAPQHDPAKEVARLEALLKATRDEAKGYRLNQAKYKQEADALKKAQAESSGDWQKIAQEREREIESERQKQQQLMGSFGKRLIQDAVSREAMKMGVVDPEAAYALLDKAGIGIDDDLAVDKLAVKNRLEELKRSKPYLFQGQAPKVHTPTPAQPSAPGGLDLDKMNSEELQAYMKKAFGKKI